VLEIQSNSQKWLNLSKELLIYRKKATEAVKEKLGIDEILPRFIIEQNGNNKGNVSGIEMTTKGDRMVKLITEANDAENRISEEKTPLSEWLFGNSEEYMDFPKQEEKTKTNEGGVTTKKGNKTKWVVVIGLSIVALSWGIWTAIGVFILGLIIIGVISNKD
jgi:hypothetical protein